MSVTPSPIGGFAAQFFDNNGVILSGGKIYTYAAGTTTPQTTYTSASGTTPHANPIVLDSAGRVPGGEIWLTDGLVYKFVIETSTAILIGSYDNITGVNSNFVNYTVQEEVITATAGQTVFNLSTINYTPNTNSLTVYIDGVNQYVGDSYLETDSNTVTFTSGVHVGGEVKFTTAIQTTTGAVNAAIVAYDPPFTGGVATNVEIKLSEYVSVKDFGAVGDGVADDTAAIQAAIDYAQSQTSARDVFFPAGQYRTTASLTVGEEKNIRLKGEGFTFTGSEIYADFAGAIFYASNAQTWAAENLVFKGDGVTAGTYGIKIDTTAGSAQVYMTFRNCTFNNLDYGVYLSNAFACRFENCEFAEIASVALEIAGGSGCIFNSLVVELCNGYGLKVDGIGHTFNGSYFENNAQNNSGEREIVVEGTCHVFNGGTIAPNSALTVPPILVYGNEVTFAGIKGFNKPTGSSAWVEVNGVNANVLLSATDLTLTGNAANSIIVRPGVPGSFSTDIISAGLSFMDSAVSEIGGSELTATTNGGATAPSGKYIAYNNGLLICYLPVYVSGSATVPLSQTWTYPKAFKAATAPFVFGTRAIDSTVYKTTASAAIKSVGITNATVEFSDNDATYSVIAVGFWK